jgi:flagellar biosynthesis/type III secretory pathway M-ring protein FliF/YscJ
VIQNFWGNAIYSLVPTILLGIVFWVVMRAIIRSDRTERKVYSDIETEERAKFDAEQLSASPKK